MFKCGDKCTGIRAAEARLVREKICLDNAVKENDCRGMKAAARKVKDTTDYIKLMEDWPASVYLAIGPALLVGRIKSPEKRAAIMKQVEQSQEMGVNPMNGKPLHDGQVTGPIIEYLIAKYDHSVFVPSKWVRLTKERIEILNYLLGKCGNNERASLFVKSILAVA